MARTRHGHFVPLGLVLALLATAVGLSGPVVAAPLPGGAVRPVGTPGDTSRITLVSSSTVDGWRYDQYRNPAYPCSVSGENTFTIATRLGTPDDAVRPLWVYLHGGGAGFFAPDGTPQPGTGQMDEENPAQQRGSLSGGRLNRAIRDAEPGFRMLAVSMCNHDLYGGPDIADPNNPNRTPDGRRRTVNGLFATKAGIQHALQTVATDDYLLYGTSAGSFGSFHVAWGLEEQGIPPTAIVADSGLLFPDWQIALSDEPCGRPQDQLDLLAGRLHPDIVEPANAPAALVADGRLSAPVLDIFSFGDPGQCGKLPITCPLGEDGPEITLGSVECLHEPMRRAFAAQGAGSRSLSMGLCAGPPAAPLDSCAMHTPTNNDNAINTDPDWPTDFIPPITDWVAERLDDDGAAPSSPPSTTEAFATAALTDLVGGAPIPKVEAGALALGAGQSKATYLGRLTTSNAWLTQIVDDLYQDTLGRPGDPAGTAYWVDALRTRRLTVARAAASFYASPEYYTGIGGGTDATWINDLYLKILGRPADGPGRTYWAGQIARTGRGAVALRFFQTPESARTRVTDLYQDLLGRSPEPSGLTYWSGRVVSDGDLALAVSLAASTEYQTRAEARFP
ncbi:MAG: DUF4214 domain-containing protein [Iamia sp.]